MTNKTKRISILSLIICLFAFTGSACLSAMLSRKVAEAETNYTLTFENPSADLASSAEGWGKGATVANGELCIDYAVANEQYYNNTGVFNTVLGKTYVFNFEHKSESSYTAYHLFHEDWTNAETFITATSDWSTKTFEYTAKKDSEQLIFQKVADSVGSTVTIRNFTIGEVVEVKNVTSDAAIGTLPVIPEKENYRGYWAVDGQEITAETLYTYGANKTATLVYESTATKYTLTFEKATSDLASSAEGWGKGATVANGEVAIDFAAANDNVNFNDTSLFNSVAGKTYTISYEHKSSGDKGYTSYHVFAVFGDQWTLLEQWIAATPGWATKTLTYTPKANGETLTFQRVDGDNGLFFRNFVITEVVETRQLEENAAIGKLPAVPEKTGYRGYWTIDGQEITAETKFAYTEAKVANVAYGKEQYSLTFNNTSANLAAKTGWQVFGEDLKDVFNLNNGGILLDYTFGGTIYYQNTKVFNSVAGKTYTISFEQKSNDSNGVSYHLFRGGLNDEAWTPIKAWGYATSEWTTSTYEYTAVENGEKFAFQSQGGGTGMWIRNFKVVEKITIKAIDDGSAIGELPEIPEKAGYRAFWTIDGEEITAETLYTYGDDKIAELIYDALEKNEITDVSISLNGDIAVNFYVKMIDNSKVYFTVDDKKAEVTEYTAKTGEKYNRVYSYVVAAKDFEKKVLLTIEGENFVSAPKAVSVQDYITAAKDTFKDDAKLIALVNALESYCKAAKTYFAGENLDAVELADDKLTSYKAAKMGTLPDGLTVRVSLILESKTTIRVYISGKEAGKIACKVDGVDVKQVEHTDGSYYIEKTDIAAKDLDKAFVFDIGSTSFYFSAYCYANQAVAQGTDANLVNVVKALYNYGVAANAYFPETENLESVTNMAKTVLLANKLENGVQGYYSNDNGSYTVSNGNVSLTHRLNKEASGMLVSTLRGEGGEYLSETMDAYLIADGKTSYGSLSQNLPRYSITDGTTPLPETACSPYVNVTKFGYYYYQVNVRNLNFGKDLYLDKTYHVYSDRTYQQYRLINNGAKAAIADSFGFEVKISLSAISKFEIYDGTDFVSSIEKSEDGRVFSYLEYVAFDISGVGVIAFIDTCENTTFKIVNTGEYVIVRQYISVGTLNAKESVEFGSRIYTDSSHGFEGVRKASEIERNPLTSENISVKGDGASFEGYDKLRGYYVFKISGTNFASAVKNPDKKYIEKITVNSVDDREIFFYVHSAALLEGAAIVDENNLLLPMGVQVSKNFDHEKEEPIYDPSDAMYGDTVFPFAAEKNATVSLSVVNVYQNWGTYPVKQLSSVSYYVAYYHLSSGVRETNCIAPYFPTGESRTDNGGWILPDFRGASCSGQAKADGSADSIQKNSIGEMHGVSNGNDSGIYQWSNIKSEGLVYVDLDYSYISKDGKFKFTYRHVEMPQTDESRTYYTVEIEILDNNVTLNYNSFRIFDFRSRGSKQYGSAAYLGADGQLHEIDPSLNINYSNGFTPRLYKLQSGSNFFAYYGLEASKEEQGNFGLIVKNYKITVNGEATDIGLALYNDRVNKNGKYYNRGALTLEKNVTFAKGDKITVNAILLPYGTSTQGNCKNVQKVYEDSVVNPLKLVAKTGTVQNDEYLPTVKAVGDRAIFTLSGGSTENEVGVNYAIKITGFNVFGRLHVEKLNANGEWETVDISSQSKFDGYDVKIENGKYDYSFIVNKTAEDVTYRVSVVK